MVPDKFIHSNCY